jgi:esterase/lipase superfamily enzyme
MQGTLDRIDSPQLGRPVHLWRYGHYGLPVVVFPSASGMAHEWEKEGMIGVLAPFVASGRVKLYCTESNVSEAWTRKDEPLARRMARHAAYERWVLDALVPFVRRDCAWPDAPISAVGCSLGATYAANMALKFPATFRRALCLSGRYLATALTQGETNTDVYFNNPLAYVSNLDGAGLDHVRRNTRLTLVCGQGKWEEGCIEETIALGALLDRKGIPAETDIWGFDSVHDWPWWKKQAAYHFGRLFGP